MKKHISGSLYPNTYSGSAPEILKTLKLLLIPQNDLINSKVKE